MMLKSLWNALILSPAMFGVIQVGDAKVIASPLEASAKLPRTPSSTMEILDAARIKTDRIPKQFPEKSHTDLDTDANPGVATPKSRVTSISVPLAVCRRDSHRLLLEQAKQGAIDSSHVDERSPNSPPLPCLLGLPNQLLELSTHLKHPSSVAVKNETLPNQLKETGFFRSPLQDRTDTTVINVGRAQQGKQNNARSNGSHKTATTDKLSVKKTDLPQIPKPPLIADNPATAESLPLTSETDVPEDANLEGSDADDGMNQVTDVSQLRDIEPGDWAYEALRELVERYGCLAGYPDQTFRGNRVLSRYEFAAGLRACLQQVEKLIAASTSNASAKQDLAIVQKLNQEFGTELAKLRGRVDGVEARTSELEARQFSITTKFRGEGFFAGWSFFAGQDANGKKIPQNTVFGARSRISLSTSFFGNDLFFFRLRARNLSSVSGTSTFTPDGDLRFAGGTFSRINARTSKVFSIDTTTYIFRPNKRTTVYISANAGEIDDVVGTLNPFVDGDGNFGSISNFGTRNSIYYLVNGAGFGVRHNLNNNFTFGYGYLANSASDPGNPPGGGGGLFNGASGALAQLVVKPTKTFNVAFTYVNAYNNELTAGSNRANLRAVLASATATLPPGISARLRGQNLPVSVNAYGIETTWRVASKFLINGWVGYTAERTLSTLGGGIKRGDLSIFNYAVVLAFPDLGKLGSLGGIVLGMEPRVTGVNGPLREQIGRRDPNTSIHVEAFYQYRVTDYLAITPGIIWVTAPNFDNHNADLVYGVLRTRFTF